MTDIAVVILNFNGIGFLRSFLETVVKYSGQNNTEVYVADNGSTDGSLTWLSENRRDVKLINLGTNHGFAGGYNLALNQIKAKYYVLLNSDVEVTEGWLTPLTEHLENNQGVAACQPKILSWSIRDHFEYAGASGGFIDKYGYPFCRGRILNHVEKDEGQYNKDATIFWSSGACMMIRSEAWERCGGFDAAFFAHMEEIDLCWRLNNAGYKISCIPASVVYHVGGGTLPYDSPFKTYLNFRNSLFLLYKNLEKTDLRRTMFIRRLLDGFAAIVFLFTGRVSSFLSVLKAHRDYYRGITDLKEKRKAVQKLKQNNYSAPVLNKSIVFEFYARGKKTFTSLNLTT